MKKLQAEADAGLKTSASYTVAKAVDDWAAEALDGLEDKTVRSHVDPWAASQQDSHYQLGNLCRPGWCAA